MSWRELCIDDLVVDGGSIKTGPFGTVLKASQYTETGVPVISVGEILDGILEVSDRTPRVDDDVLRELLDYRLQTGDIVFARKGAVERTSIVREAQDGWLLGSDAIRLRLGGGVNSKYVAYQLRSPEKRQWLQQHAGGSTLLSLNQKIIGRIPLRIPDRVSQERVAAVLASLDEKIAANDRLATLAEDLAQSIFDQATVHLPRVSAGTRLAPILGGTPARDRVDYWQGTTPWISARDVTSASHGVVVSTFEHISDEASRRTRAKTVPAGSTILTARGTVGAVVRLGVAASFNQSCYGFIPGEFSSSALYFVIKSLVAEAREAAHGSVFDTITMRTFDHVQIPNLQQGSMAALEARLAPLLGSVEQAVSESETLASLRDTLLPALMSGRLSVRDAEDMVSEVV